MANSNAQLAAIRRRLLAIPKPMIEAAHASLKASADELAATMKAGAPEDHGDLVASIQVTDTSNGDHPARFRVTAGGPKTTRTVDGKKGAAYTYDYALAAEYGSRDASGRHQAATPFFWPSYRRMKKKIRARLSRALKKAAKEAK